MKRNRILSAVLAVVMAASLCCTPAFAATTPVTDEYIVTENGVTKVYDPITGDLWYDTVNGRTDAFQKYYDYVTITKKGSFKNTDPDWNDVRTRDPAWMAIVKLENGSRPTTGFGTFGSSNDFDGYNPDGIDFVNPDIGELYYNDIDVNIRKEVDSYLIKDGARLSPYMKGIIGDNIDTKGACLGLTKSIPTNLCDNVTFELKDGVLTLKGDGKTRGIASTLNMVSYHEPWAANEYIKTIVIDGRIPTTTWSFSNLTNLETVIIMNNSSDIGIHQTPFQDCPNLKTIIWGANLKDEKGLRCMNYGKFDPQGRVDPMTGNPYSQYDKDLTAELDTYLNNMAGKTFINGRSSKFIPVKVPNTVALTSYYGDWDARVAKAKQYIAEADLPAEVLAMLPAELGGTAGKAGTTPETKPAPDQGQSEVITETSMDKTISDWARGQVADAEGWNLIPFQALGTNYKTAITRGQFCALATRLCEELDGEELPYDTDVFTDVDNTNTDILKMYKAGIIGGYGNGKFGPNDPLTREQAATIIVRLCEVMDAELANTKPHSFTDKFNTWGVEAVGKVYSAGIMSGYNNTTFGAWDSYTIEQSIISLYRTCCHVLVERGELGQG